jgi:gluconate kinase
MKSEMLVSQFADLEEPADGIIVDASVAPDVIVTQILNRLPTAV